MEDDQIVRKPKHSIHYFWEETWRANIDLIWPVTPQDVVHYIKWRFGTDYKNLSPFGGRCIEMIGERNVHVICLSKWRDNATDQATLAHECFHCTEQILSQRGVKFVNEEGFSNEVYAYTFEGIFRRCLEGIRAYRPA